MIKQIKRLMFQAPEFSLADKENENMEDLEATAAFISSKK